MATSPSVLPPPPLFRVYTSPAAGIPVYLLRIGQYLCVVPVQYIVLRELCYKIISAQLHFQLFYNDQTGRGRIGLTIDPGINFIESKPNHYGL